MSDQNSVFDLERIERSLQGPFHTVPDEVMVDIESFIKWLESLSDEP